MICTAKHTERNGDATATFRNGDVFATVTDGIIVAWIRGHAAKTTDSLLAKYIAKSAAIGDFNNYVGEVAAKLLARPTLAD